MKDQIEERSSQLLKLPTYCEDLKVYVSYIYIQRILSYIFSVKRFPDESSRFHSNAEHFTKRNLNAYFILGNTGHN